MTLAELIETTIEKIQKQTGVQGPFAALVHPEAQKDLPPPEILRLEKIGIFVVPAENLYPDYEDVLPELEDWNPNSIYAVVELEEESSSPEIEDQEIDPPKSASREPPIKMDETTPEDLRVFVTPQTEFLH